MARNTERDAIQMAEKQKKILETAFRVFSERTIESVTMTDIAKEAGVGIATLYRYYSTKPKLVLAIVAMCLAVFQHRGNISRLLKGEENLTLETLCKLERALNRPIMQQVFA